MLREEYLNKGLEEVSNLCDLLKKQITNITTLSNIESEIAAIRGSLMTIVASTKDKDTGKPLYTNSEAREMAIDSLAQSHQPMIEAMKKFTVANMTKAENSAEIDCSRLIIGLYKAFLHGSEYGQSS